MVKPKNPKTIKEGLGGIGKMKPTSKPKPKK